jgi:HK97 family phage major capsid protein
VSDDESFDDRFTSTQDLLERRGKLVARIEAMHARYGDDPMEGADADAFNRLNAHVDELDQKLNQREIRQARLRELAKDPRNVVSGDGAVPYGGSRRVEENSLLHPTVRMEHDKALRTIERYADQSDSNDKVDRFVRQGDPTGQGSRYINAVGDIAYATAFSKMLEDPTTAHFRYSAEDVAAVRAAFAEFRALSTGTSGIPIPYQLDPSLMISGSGALNPLRSIARVEQINEGTWKGATSAEVSASYDAEASEVSDDTPALTQPSITAARGSAFIPFSIEAGQDWAGIVEELGRLLADGRDILDASKMLTGTGSNEPGGILNIGGTGGLTTSQRIQTATTAAFAVGDVYLLKQALPARFMPNAVYTWHPNTLDVIYRFVAEGSTSEPKQMPEGRSGPLLGKRAYEWSSMATGASTGTKLGIYGNFRNFLVADRLGFSVELVPHLFGSANRFPTGQRGLVSFWRSGSGVLVANAFRYLEVK